jgi:spore coat polysaccharide biosynthesis protein SpsF
LAVAQIMGRTVAVVQARTTSSRLPGKVLMDINGEPMLIRILNRLSKCKELDEVVVACTDKSSDDAIHDLVWTHGIHVIRGSEQDVLSRYALAARETKADAVVRITSDCPMIEPEVVDRAVRALRSGHNDMSSNSVKRSYPKGLDVEVVWADVLYRLDRMAITPQAREHVLWHCYKERPDLYVIKYVVDTSDNSHMSWTVDTQADLDHVRDLVKKFGDKGYREIIAGLLLEAA